MSFLHKSQFQNYLPRNESTQSNSHSDFLEFQFTVRENNIIWLSYFQAAHIEFVPKVGHLRWEHTH